ncbi:MAG TPA: alkaline phosphatase D family protein, partial [Archangium sp.]
MSQPLHRRTVLKCLVAVAASTAFGCEGESPVQEGRAFFPQSVASGDPRSDSVVLWTRAVDPARPDAEQTLTLQVATNEGVHPLVLELGGLRVTSAHDHILKVKVTNLQPGTRYFYRFLLGKKGHQRLGSQVGRTRTAPAPDAGVPVRFVVANCQDFRGRYYNSWQRLLQLDEELDFIVFLGDYIYEADSAVVPSPDPARNVSFTDPGSAQPRRVGGGTELVASSVSNYRDLYRTYRSDAFLQRVHERYPFIVTWDDHEFSNDCWDAHATYTDGRTEELQPERRRNAEQAFFEYLPIDTTGAPPGPIDVDAEPRYPDTRIWRDFVFGRHLRLFATDYRTHRPDHLIPEDAYPATVAMDAAVLAALGATAVFSADLFAYVNIDDFPERRAVLRGAYVQLAVAAGLSPEEAAARAAAVVRGNLALAYVNPTLAAAAVPGAGPLSPTGTPRGLAFVHMGKQALFSSI